jgi:hypothetical protein
MRNIQRRQADLKVGAKVPVAKSSARMCNLLVIQAYAAQKSRKSRPGGFHPEPLAEPDVNLSAHPAPIKQTRQSNGLSVARIEVLLFPVASVMQPLDPTPSLQLDYEPSWLLRIGPPQCSSVPRLAVSAAWASSFTSERLVPAVPRDSLHRRMSYDGRLVTYNPAKAKLYMLFSVGEVHSKLSLWKPASCVISTRLSFFDHTPSSSLP